MELQSQLSQSEAKLKQMQKGMSSGGYVSNGPSAEAEHGSGGISPSECMGSFVHVYYLLYFNSLPYVFSLFVDFLLPFPCLLFQLWNEKHLMFRFPKEMMRERKAGRIWCVLKLHVELKFWCVLTSVWFDVMYFPTVCCSLLHHEEVAPIRKRGWYGLCSCTLPDPWVSSDLQCSLAKARGAWERTGEGQWCKESSAPGLHWPSYRGKEEQSTGS